KSMRQKGAVVFFEPSSAKGGELFSSCLAVADIVKYSAERLPRPPRNPVSRSPRLEVQTFGSDGLRYRLKKNSTTPGGWNKLPAVHVRRFQDDTGCGDWCSAGMISMLCGVGRDTFLRLDEEGIYKGIRFGQVLATINCEFVGARGPIYNLTSDELLLKAHFLVSLPESPQHNHT